MFFPHRTLKIVGQIYNQDSDNKNFALSKVLLSRFWSFIKTTKNVHPPPPLSWAMVGNSWRIFLRFLFRYSLNKKYFPFSRNFSLELLAGEQDYQVFCFNFKRKEKVQLFLRKMVFLLKLHEPKFLYFCANKLKYAILGKR